MATRSVAVVVVVSLFAAQGVVIKPAAAEGPIAASAVPITYGPYTVAPNEDEPSGASFSYTYTPGAAATCGPDAMGNGWYCEPHRPHLVEYNAQAPRYDTFAGAPMYDLMTVRLYLAPPGAQSLTLLSEKSASCSGSDWCATTAKTYPTSSYWTAWQGITAGDLVGRIILRHHDYFTGVTSTWDSGVFPLDRTIPRVFTADEVENSPPYVQRVTYPGPSGILDSPEPLHRSGPEHFQSFAASVYEAENHNLTAELGVYNPGREPCEGTADVSYEWAQQKSVPTPPKPFTDPGVPSHPVGLTTPPLQLPHMNGTYSVCLWTRDTSGTATAQGPPHVATFDYVWNTAPVDPQQTVPTPEDVATGQRTTFPPNVPVVLLAKVTDPENDLVTVRTLINGQREYESFPTMSGQEAFTIIDEGFQSGANQWASIRGSDVHDELGDYGEDIFFDVLASPTENRPPTRAQLITPAHGARLAHGVPQDFAILASDEDGDPYRAVVEIVDGAGAPVSVFATEEAPSGQASSGRPLQVVPAGDYRWRARAFDDLGALGQPSDWRPFSVAASNGTVVSDDCAAGTTFTQATAAQHYAHLQAAGDDICWRVDGSSVTSGGKLTLTLPGAGGTPLPSVDENTDVCFTELLDAGAGNPGSPDEVTVRIAVAASPGEVSLCVQLGEERRRLRQRFPGGGGTPAISFDFDPPGRFAGTIVPTPGLPSSACSGQQGSTTHLAALVGPVFTHVTSWQETSTRLHLCIREEWAAGVGGPSAGGRLTFDTTGAPGTSLVLETGTDDVGCTERLAFVEAPARVAIWRGPATNPASVCVLVGDAWTRVVAGASGDPSSPAVTWTPDPGTSGF